MKADTRGQFKAAAYPRTVTGACGPVLKRGSPRRLSQGLLQANLVFVITLLNHLFNSLFIVLSALLSEEEAKPVPMYW